MIQIQTLCMDRQAGMIQLHRLYAWTDSHHTAPQTVQYAWTDRHNSAKQYTMHGQALYSSTDNTDTGIIQLHNTRLYSMHGQTWLILLHRHYTGMGRQPQKNNTDSRKCRTVQNKRSWFLLPYTYLSPVYSLRGKVISMNSHAWCDHLDWRS